MWANEFCSPLSNKVVWIATELSTINVHYREYSGTPLNGQAKHPVYPGMKQQHQY